MKIKLAILDNDVLYLNRVASVFGTRYADRVEVYSFTDPDMAVGMLGTARVDVFLANERFDISVKELPVRCAFAYFVEDAGLRSFRGQKTVGKYQRAELIYNQVLNLYSEKAEGVADSGDGKNTKLYWFFSAGGGCGSSSAAAAAAVFFAKEGKKVLFLSLDVFGEATSYFQGEGQFDFSDVIYALKSRKDTAVLKLESVLRQDVATGVYFYAPTQLALDMTELDAEDMQQLIVNLKKAGLFDAVVIDKQFGTDAGSCYLWKAVNTVVAVNDGSEIGNSKFLRAYAAMKVLAEQDDEYRLDKLMLLYNKFSNKTGQILEDLDATLLGGIPKYEHASVQQIMEQMSGMDIFRKL